jgi:hypothetical protein
VDMPPVGAGAQRGRGQYRPQVPGLDHGCAFQYLGG